MKQGILALSLATLSACAMYYGVSNADEENDFGSAVEQQLRAKSVQLFGVNEPLAESAYGPYTDADNTKAVILAKGLKAYAVSNVTDKQADMIAFWPNDYNPTHAFVCIENFFSGNNPNTISVQRVNLAGDPNSNVETIVKGISSCDPVKRTPWSSIVVGEEADSNGGFYEIMDPMSLSGAAPAVITDRAAGTSTDSRVVKRKAVGNLSWEGVVILENGTMYFGDEKRPGNGKAGGGIYKFVPATPYIPATGVITDPNLSPFASGNNYGMRLGTRSGNTDYSQGSEIGKGIWVAVNAASYADAFGNINLGSAQNALGLTGYYRPEDMDRDPVAAKNGLVRNCWANTGRITNAVTSDIENGHNYGEIMCLSDVAETSATTGFAPVVTRFVAGDRDMNQFDNVAFQPHSGVLYTQEDSETEALNADGTLKELRGTDIWACLPDGKDRDVQSDGCVRVLSIKDTDAESTGFIFDASGERAYVNIQHRSTGQGALLRIEGFKVK
ncbi:MAG: PhoX family protein [Gammaproteobacteria bacterium]|nr:PhoX family protein [Gammaproteobacteria bacterium]